MSNAAKIEALLFLAGEAILKTELARLINQSPQSIDSILKELQQSLTDHGLTIVTTDTHAQLTTSSTVAEYVNQYVQDEGNTISLASAEVLSIIAYRGPVSAADVSVIRGVDSRRLIRALVARGLIRKSQGSYRVSQYEVTEEFLQHLGITRRENLPQFESLKSSEKIAALLEQQPKTE